MCSCGLTSIYYAIRLCRITLFSASTLSGPHEDAKTFCIAWRVAVCTLARHTLAVHLNSTSFTLALPSSGALEHWRAWEYMRQYVYHVYTKLLASTPWLIQTSITSYLSSPMRIPSLSFFIIDHTADSQSVDDGTSIDAPATVPALRNSELRTRILRR